MTPQLSFADAATAQAAKDDAIERVSKHANPQWKAMAMTTAENLARALQEFTTDDVWFVMGTMGSLTHEPRAMGAITTEAKRRGWIEPTGRYVQSQRKECHARPVLVWRSRIYGGKG